jgi:hypothetical protein
MISMSDEKDFYVDPAVLAESIQLTLQRLETEHSARLAELPAAKAEIVAKLKSAGLEAVRIHYDGVGDSGQIDDIWTLDAAHDRLEPLRETGETQNDQHALVDALDAFAWKVLEAHHQGFEIDGGSYGYITIDVAKDEIFIAHTERNEAYTEV